MTIKALKLLDDSTGEAMDGSSHVPRDCMTIKALKQLGKGKQTLNYVWQVPRDCMTIKALKLHKLPEK